MDRQEHFLRLFLQHQGDLRAFIGSLVRDPNQRDDVFQEVALVCWRDFDRYDPERPFGAWARGIAANKVKQLWDRSSRAPTPFEPETIDAIRAAFDRSEADVSPRLEALRKCLEELPKKARRLLAYRYQYKLSPREIANRIEAQRDAVYKALARTLSLMGVSGRIQSEDGVVHLLVDRVWEPRLAAEPNPERNRDFH
jgi:RNA polymerase sigma-70 factor (ECF subfamily)